MYILSVNMWFQKLMKQFFFGIDQVVYNAISSIYDLLISIARTSVFTQADILDMADRIYKLLAIFMIFKVTLSLITYVVNPDDFSDKSKGISKLSMNIVISLGLLILTPYIFNLAFRLQTIILEDNTMATLIFGEDEDTGGNFINTAGDEMAFITMSAFFTPNTSINELQSCVQLTDSSGKVNPDCSGLNNDNYEKADGTKNTMYSLTDAVVKDSDFSLTALQNYIAGVNNENLGLMFRQEMAVATVKGNSQFVMDYKYIFSTVVGVVIVLLLISFCMDVALRSIKLGFLQLIAPIPILSYVDPKSGKDGMFKKWYQLCFKTYLSLFIRLLALYFAVYIIEKVADMKLVDVVDGSYQTHAFIYIFVIIGALMFAKDLPKILEGLGIKLDGGGKFTLNPLRKMENEMMGGKYLKKPNDSLTNFAKGGFGMGTLAKKTISGIDAARHGKGFKNGFDRYKGGFGKWIDKQKEGWMPYSYEDEKERKKGHEQIAQMRSKWERGEKAWTGMRKKYPGVEKLDSLLDGISDNREAYIAAGFNGDFLTSKMNLDHASERQKILNRIYQARQMGTPIEVALEAEAANLERYGIKRDKISTDVGLYAAVDSVNKEVSGKEKVHESMRLQFQDQAVLEDSLKFVKYNHIDPVTGSVSVLESGPVSAAKQQDQVDGPEQNDGASDKQGTMISEERQRRLRIEARIGELKSEKTDLEHKKSVTSDGDEFMRIVQRIKQIDLEIENLQSQL